MATITGTLRGCNLKNKANQGAGTTTRDGLEVWELTYDFAAYTGSSDDATVTGVPAAISARVRDGKTRTLLWGAPAYCGADANNQPVNFCGTSVAALTISTNDFTGELCTVNTVSTEVTATSGVTAGVGILVGVAVT
jgi:hypothetical protein